MFYLSLLARTQQQQRALSLKYERVLIKWARFDYSSAHTESSLAERKWNFFCVILTESGRVEFDKELSNACELLRRYLIARRPIEGVDVYCLLVPELVQQWYYTWNLSVSIV